MERQEYAREYYKKNNEKIKESKRKYYENNKEKFKEWNKKWREENIEKYRENRRIYNNEHPEYRKKSLEKFKEKNNWSEYCSQKRKERVERLRKQGCTNAWSVVTKGAEPKFKEVI